MREATSNGGSGRDDDNFGFLLDPRELLVLRLERDGAVRREDAPVLFAPLVGVSELLGSRVSSRVSRRTPRTGGGEHALDVVKEAARESYAEFITPSRSVSAREPSDNNLGRFTGR